MNRTHRFRWSLVALSALLCLSGMALVACGEDDDGEAAEGEGEGEEGEGEEGEGEEGEGEEGEGEEGEGEGEVCSGHGEMDVNHCDCDEGYRTPPGDRFACEEIGDCNGYGHLEDGECVCTTEGSEQDPEDPTNCLSPVCNGHGFIGTDHCECDPGYRWPSQDEVMSCVLVVCDGHGDLVRDVCNCDEGFHQNPADAADCVPDPYEFVEREPYQVEIDLHGDQAKMNLHTMEVFDVDAEEWDLWVDDGEAADGGKAIRLNTGHGAIDLGTTTTFQELTEAPEDGYVEDDFPNKDFAIGGSYREGTGCAASLTHHLYVVRLSDGTHVKLEVTDTVSGIVGILLYRQPDPESRDLSTDPLE